MTDIPQFSYSHAVWREKKAFVGFVAEWIVLDWIIVIFSLYGTAGSSRRCTLYSFFCQTIDYSHLQTPFSPSTKSLFFFFSISTRLLLTNSPSTFAVIRATSFSNPFHAIAPTQLIDPTENTAPPPPVSKYTTSLLIFSDVVPVVFTIGNSVSSLNSIY